MTYINKIIKKDTTNSLIDQIFTKSTILISWYLGKTSPTQITKEKDLSIASPYQAEPTVWNHYCIFKSSMGKDFFISRLIANVAYYSFMPM